jgi:hypothetical protein
MNSKAQFSIIAALLVAIILIATTMTTYATIRYNPVSEQPQILTAVDETNLGLKGILGFTVGYYGSVLKVTGNMTYAQQLAKTYLSSGLNNIGEIRPEWGTRFNLTYLDLHTNWFSNQSYSLGNMTVTYDMGGLGISGVSYSTSTRLDVQISKANSTSQAQLTILMDDDQPLINLGKSNLKFYHYNYQTSAWELSEPAGIASYADGTYVLDLPQGVLSDAYVIQVQDIRGLMVVAASFSQYTSTLAWNTTGFQWGLDYVDAANSIVGSHSDFTTQQAGPDGVYDTLTEAAFGTTLQPSYSTSYNMLGSTSLAGGTVNDVQSNNANYLSFHSYGTAFGGSATFGYLTKGGSTTTLNNIKGSRFALTQDAHPTSISAYLRFTSSSGTFGNTATTGSSGDSIIDSIRGQRFTSPATPVSVASIAAYITCTTTAKNMKAAIYDNSGNLVAASTEQSIPTNANPAWRTFTFASAPTLAESTNYVLVVWSQTGTGTAVLRYSSATGGSGRYVASQTYGNWPESLTLQSNAYQYCVYCNYNTEFKAKAAIYSNLGDTLVGSTDEQTFGTVDNWVTFNFASQPLLTANNNYVLVVWSSDTSNVAIYRDTGSARRFEGTGTYPTWPATIDDQTNQRTYSVYCTYSPANQYTAQVEFSGNSVTPLPWNDLVWALDSSASTNGVAATYQLYNYVTGQYVPVGDGYLASTLGLADTPSTQTIAASPSSFQDGSGNWKILVTAVKSTATSFDLNLDLVQYSPEVPNYALNLEESWLTVNATNLRQDLCIKTGALGAEPLLVQVWHGGAWRNLITLAPNYFNNVSLAPYINSSTLTIRFVGGNDLTDIAPDNWQIDCALIKDEPDVNFLVNLQESTFTLEVLQNGTMLWLGQNMQSTGQTLPIPPVSVKAIHVNQTICGVNQEVPFQIEDWASNYQIPLGMSGNTTVFSNRQMIVFLLNSKVSEFTIWWNASDATTQTPLAYTNKYFTNDNTAGSTLTNGNVTLLFGSFNIKSTVAGTTTFSTSNFMRINNEASSYGSGISWVIHHGVVRDIVQQEAEWNTGPNGCPNLYANIIITLPANTTYYTYQLRVMFITSSQARSINDLNPIQLTTSVTSPQTQTENGTLAGSPLVQNGTGTFNNIASSGNWTAHHFSQFISDAGKGAGIMFTDYANQKLYAFNCFSGSTSKGAIKVSAGLLELLPVSASQVQFTFAYDITWHGAVVTFDNTTPMCRLYDGTTPMGLWILAEYPPTVTVTARS